MPGWFYAIGDQRHGPVDDAALAGLVGCGVVTPTTMVWSAGMPAWRPAGEVPGLASPAPAAPAAPAGPADPLEGLAEASAAKPRPAARRRAGSGGAGRFVLFLVLGVVGLGVLGVVGLGVLVTAMFGGAEKRWERATRQAVAEYNRGNCVECERQLVNALDIAHSEFGPRDERFTASVRNLCDFYRNVGLYGELYELQQWVAFVEQEERLRSAAAAPPSAAPRNDRFADGLREVFEKLSEWSGKKGPRWTPPKTPARPPRPR
jgi:hypothetical protein